MSPRPKKLRLENGELPDGQQDMRTRILIEAKILFRKMGYAAVSTNDIIREAGITKPTLYHYFKDKESLFAEVLVEMMRHGADYIQDGLKGKRTLREKLYSLAQGFFTYSPTSMTTMMRDALEQLGDIPRKKVMSAYQYHVILPLEVVFQEARESGEISKEVNPNDLAVGFLSLLDSYTLNRTAVSGRQFDFDQQAQQLVSVMLDGIKLKEPHDSRVPE